MKHFISLAAWKVKSNDNTLQNEKEEKIGTLDIFDVQNWSNCGKIRMNIFGKQYHNMFKISLILNLEILKISREVFVQRKTHSVFLFF